MIRACVAAVALVVMAGCGSADQRGEPHSAAGSTPRPTKVVKLDPRQPAERTVGLPLTCPKLFVVLYCHPGAGSANHVAIKKTRQLSYADAGRGAAFGMGAALAGDGEVVVHGRDQGGALYVVAYSDDLRLVAVFRQLGLETEGTVTVNLRCLNGQPVTVLRRPDGSLVGPDVQTVQRMPREIIDRNPVADVCRKAP